MTGQSTETSDYSVWNVETGPVSSIYVHYFCFAVTKVPDTSAKLPVLEEEFILPYSFKGLSPWMLVLRGLGRRSCYQEPAVEKHWLLHSQTGSREKDER